MLINKNDIIHILDSMASTLPAMYPINEPGANLRGIKLSIITSELEACNYLSIKWDHETRHGYFGDTFLSLAVIYEVIAYVKVRATEGCLVQKPYSGSRSKPWPLLMDAVCTGSFSIEMVECLLSLGADPNFSTPSDNEAIP
jgi:hypothetical protein